MKMSKALSERISSLLEAQKKTAYRLERELRMPPRTIYNVASAKYASANVRTIFLICKGLGITIGEFFSHPIFEREELEVD